MLRFWTRLRPDSDGQASQNDKVVELENMKVALVHDDLVQWGGAERVLEGICEMYPDAPIFTSVYDKDHPELAKRFGSRKIYTSFLQKIPGWKSLYKALLPLYPIAFEQFDFSEFDLVISNTTRFAKSIITKPATKHICYCHTPPRFLWHFSGQGNFWLGEILMTKLRVFDQVSAARVDHFLAGSENAERRIKKVYKRNSKVVYPFIDLDRFQRVETFDGGYFVVISRLNKYKRVDLAVEACMKLGKPLKIIGTGPEMNHLSMNYKPSTTNSLVEFLGNLDDEMVVQVLAGAKALIVPGIEDFGMSALEAQALGKPVVAFRASGALETVIENKTGIFFDEPTVDSLVKVLTRSGLHHWNPDLITKNAIRFSKENFKRKFQAIVASV